MGGTTAYGKSISKTHVKEDKKLLKDRIKLEKKQVKIDHKHAKDHLGSASRSQSKISTLQKQMKNKGKSTGIKS